MSGARVQLVRGLPVPAAWQFGDPLIPPFGWRLLGGNQRELARSTGGFEDAESAGAAVLDLQAAIGRAGVLLLLHPVTGYWSWRLRLEDADVAASGRSYQRRRESESNVALALAALATAALMPQVLVVPPGRRRGSAQVTPAAGRWTDPERAAPRPVSEPTGWGAA